MKEVLNNDAPLRRYLLGETAHDEELRVEERLLVDDDYMELLEVVEDELIDSCARGELKARARRKFKQYFLVTDERRNKLRLATVLVKHANKNAAVTDLTSGFPAFIARLRQLLPKPLPAPALGVALATLVIGVGFGIYWLFIYQSETRRGLRALNEAFSQRRPLESRISAMNHAPYSVTRGDEDKLAGINKQSLKRAAIILVDLPTEKPNPASYHATGRYYLTQKDYVQARDYFDSALKADGEKPKLDITQKAQLHSDYAVALMEKAKIEKQKDPVKYELGMAESREHLHEALKLNSELPEAMFNLGLWLQQRRLWRQAEEAWNKYLEKDPKSPWADEARNYRDIAIEEAKRQASLNPQELRRDFLSAYHANDKQGAWYALSHNREPITGRMVWWQLTEAFLDAANNNRSDQANDLLRALAYAGELELEKGDRFTWELAAFYRSTSSQQHHLLAQAHALTNQAHGLCLNSKYADALDHYSRAKELFKQAKDNLEIRLAELMIGHCHLQTAQSRQSLMSLDQLARICKSKQYLSLQVQVLSTMGASHFALSEYSKSIEKTKQGVQIAEQIEDTDGIQKNLAQLSNINKYLDDFHQSLAYLHRCLELASNNWPGSRQMWRTYHTLAQILNSLRLYSAAANYQREALFWASGDHQDPALIATSYLQLGAIYGSLGDYTEAIKLAQLGFRASQSSGGRSIAYALLRLGHLYRQTKEFNQAVAHYDQAIEKSQEIGDLIYSAHKGRLMCHLSQGNYTAAKEELHQVLTLAEKYRTKIFEERHKNTFFDAEQSVYDIAIDIEYSHSGSHQTAYEYSEISRARSLLDLISTRTESSGNKNKSSAFLSSVTQGLNLKEIQERLPEETQILQYAALENKLIIWVISKTKFEHAEYKIGNSELQEKVLGFWRSVARASKDKQSELEVARQAKALYKILIAPVELRNLLDKGKTICVVPDKALNYLPFNALVSPATDKRLTDKRLIADYRLTFAPSSTVFLLCSEWAQRRDGRMDERLLSVGNPSFNKQTYDDLPASEREANKVASFYRSSKVLIGPAAREAMIGNLLGRFDVLHLATHYVVDERSPMLSKLLLAEESPGPNQNGQQDGVLQGEEIYRKRPLHARLAVLSACRSGVERYYNGEGMIGMSRTFIASGVPMVVASLWPVDSEATSELMVNFHRYRKQEGCSTAEALRRAQLDMSNSQRYSHPNYWASFVVIGGHAGY